MRKPTPAAIRRAEPLSASAAHGAGPDFVCDVCGLPGELAAWREHDEHDQPIAGPGATVYVANDHPACRKAVADHARLYDEIPGMPGSFPKLCGPCVHRRELGCCHPALKSNGGTGLQVQISNWLAGAIFCGRGGQIRPPRHALACVGQSIRGEAT